uniref:Putative secreted protein n=1 Tax=Anopheles darlingi TaxID=43151 RepID=A0A2M4D338_ANODA
MLQRLTLRITISIFLSVIIMLQSLLGTDMQTPGVFLDGQEIGKPNTSTQSSFPPLFIHRFLVRILLHSEYLSTY